MRAGQLGIRRTGDGERRPRLVYFLFEIVSMVSEPNKMKAAHSIAVEAKHRTLKSIKEDDRHTRDRGGTPAMWGEIIPLSSASEITLP